MQTVREKEEELTFFDEREIALGEIALRGWRRRVRIDSSDNFSLFFVFWFFFSSGLGMEMWEGVDIIWKDEKGELRIDIIAPFVRILKMKHTIWSEQYRFYERS